MGRERGHADNQPTPHRSARLLATAVLAAATATFAMSGRAGAQEDPTTTTTTAAEPTTTTSTTSSTTTTTAPTEPAEGAAVDSVSSEDLIAIFALSGVAVGASVGGLLVGERPGSKE